MEFKIDLIVWKYALFPRGIVIVKEFKIDLIVWKCSIYENVIKFDVGLK